MKISFKKYIIILLLVFILSTGSTLAYYSWGSTSNINVAFDVIADYVYITYDGGSHITGSSLYPTDDKADGIEKTITVKVEEESDKATFNLYLDLTDIPEALLDESFRYALYNGTTLIKEGSITDTTSSCSINSTNHIVLLNGVTPSTTITTYTLYLWIDGANYTNPNDMMNQEFEFVLHATGDYVRDINTAPGTLYYEMNSNSYLDDRASMFVSSSSGINFKQISSDTNGKGIYKLASSKDTTFPILYYRGAVENNNLLFADFCWKIVRTTETGGIKLIYNGVPTDGTCNNTGEDSQLGTSKFNSATISLAYVGYMYGTIYSSKQKSMTDITDTYYYGNSVTYSNGTYTLIDTISSSDWSSIYSSGLNNYHYTCFSTTTSCSTVYFITFTGTDLATNIELNNGEKIENAISNMLDYNTTSSTIKGNKDAEGTLDYWYYNNIELKKYSNYIEDTIWCNDRSIENLSGFNPNGGNLLGYLYFYPQARRRAGTINLNCTNLEDKFTVSIHNGNGNLDYPIGLLTSDEVMLAGGDSSRTSNDIYYLYNGENYSTMSPYSISGGINARLFFVGEDGSLQNGGLVNSSYGVRPSISLKPGTKLVSGDGTYTSPFVIE